MLAGWSQGGAAGLDLARRGVEALNGQGALLRMPYWLSLLSDLYERNGEPQRARADLDAATVVAIAHDDVWWLPEVMRRRARYDDDVDAIVRLEAAVRLAREQHSHALVVRCEADLAARTATTRATATTS